MDPWPILSVLAHKNAMCEKQAKPLVPPNYEYSIKTIKADMK